MDGERDGRREGSGPIPLPPDLRARDPRWAWAVSLAVVLLGLLLYAATRSPGGSPLRHPAPPTWGAVGLAQIAKTAAGAAGDSHAQSAVWVAARRADAMQLLTGQSADTAESDYVVELTGHFRAGAGPDWLQGTLPSGPHLILLVRAFDGSVNGRMIVGTPGPDLSRLGPVGVLRIGWW